MPIADLASGRIHYRLDGRSDAPVLMFSNSLGADLSMWEPQVAAFAPRFRVLRYDTRGHGGSAASPGPYAIAQLGGDVVALLDHLELSRVHFCGLSMGGAIGQWLALHAPHRLDRLVLANTAAKFGTPELWRARVDAVNAGGVAAIADAVLGRWFTAGYAAREPAMLARMKAMMTAVPAAGYASCAAAVRDVDLRGDLGRIATPTLVIVGTHDMATPPADGALLVAGIPGTRRIELDAAHISNIEAEGAFNAALTSFLD